MSEKPTYEELEQRVRELGKAESERKQAEERIRLLAEMADIAPNSILVHDFNGRIIYANQRTFEMHGYEEDEFMAMNLHDIDVLESEQQIAPRMKQIDETGEASFEVSHFRKDMSVFPMLIYVKKIHWAGEPAMLSIGTDITKRKQAEKEIDLRGRIIENMIGGVNLIGTDDLKIKYTNPEFEKLFGYNPGEMLNQDISIINAPTDLTPQESSDSIVGILRKAGSWNGEIQNIKKDGTLFWCYASASLFEHPYYGEVIVSVHTDITKRKQAEEALRESEEKHRRIYRNMIDGVWIYSVNEDRFTYTNEAILQTRGFTVEEGLSQTLDDVLPPKYYQLALETFGNEIAKDGQKDVDPDRHILLELEEINKDGSTRPIEIIASFLRDDKGEIADILGVTRDITKRKQAEEELRESEEKYRTILENMEEGYYEVDLAGNFTFVNDAMCRIRGMSRDELMGINNREYMTPETAKAVYEAYSKVYATGEPAKNLEWETIRPDGTKRYVETSAYLMKDSENAPTGFRGVVRDVTERMRVKEEREKLESQLQQAQKMEAIGILGAGIAHDFNNLLSIIIGYIELAQDDITSETGASEFLNEANKASLKAQELTKQLTTFSKGGAPVKETGSIEDLVREITDASLSDSGVNCEFIISSDLYAVKFDKGQMNHAVRNIITNAVESMPDRGSITIKADNFTKTTEGDLPIAEGNYVKISIQDHGIGIPEEHLSKIFDPYFSTKERGTHKGMGMGLATTYAVISRHDGHVAVESEVGVGTTFTLYLPALEQPTVDLRLEQEPKIEEPAIPTGRILVMDDEEMIRNLSKQRLSLLGYEPEVAKDGAEAVELYGAAKDSGRPFDIVILDLTIKGGAGGEEVIKKLMAIDPDIKAIVSSGYSNDAVMTDFKAYGFVGALPKPYIKDDLIDILNKVIKGKV